VEEDGHKRILRERRIKAKINKHSKLLSHCHLNAPQPVPWKDNDHFKKAMDTIRSFEMCYNFFTCAVCLETILNCMSNYSEGICKRCKADKNPIKMFSLEKNMDPGILPNALLDLTPIEQHLFARKSTCMHVCMLKHGGIASTGHLRYFPPRSK